MRLRIKEQMQIKGKSKGKRTRLEKQKDGKHIKTKGRKNKKQVVTNVTMTMKDRSNRILRREKLEKVEVKFKEKIS